MLILITCSKESDAGSDAYASSATQNTYTPPTTTTTTTTVTQYTLAVTAAEGGGVSSTGGTYDDGTSVSITATPNEGYEFAGWNGTDMSSSTITIVLTANTTIEALFNQVQTTTTVTQFTLAVSASNGGTVSTEGGDFEEGTEVTITATANTGYRFTGWEGSDSTSESLTITLNSDQTYQALFELIPIYTLSVTASAEEGTVSTEGGDFEEGTEVTITATANTGYRFTGWEGSDSTSESLTITLNSDQTYQALFELIPASVYTISVTAQGSANYILTGDDANGSVSGNDPSVSLKVGDTLNFSVNAQGHPFYLIKTSNGGVGSGNLIDGVSNNGAVSATVSWTPNEAGTYYYICEYHSSMLGTITVTE